MNINDPWETFFGSFFLVFLGLTALAVFASCASVPPQHTDLVEAREELNARCEQADRALSAAILLVEQQADAGADP
jgi:hypothetical protein